MHIQLMLYMQKSPRVRKHPKTLLYYFLILIFSFVFFVDKLMLVFLSRNMKTKIKIINSKIDVATIFFTPNG